MSTTRRHLLKTATAAIGAGMLKAAPAPKSPNDTVQIALIGAGGQGMGDVRSSLATPGVKLVAVADCYEGRLTRSKELWGNDVFTTRDYREVLARPEVDAIILATPDHWHSIISIEAMNAGKDVYCEKPMVQHVEDGKPVIAAKEKTGRICQIGSQRVSSVVYQKAKDLLKAGAIGEFNMVEAWWDRNSSIGAWQYTIPPDASTDTCDWNRFQGRAKHVAWDPKRFFRWRNYQDYGTGVAGDLFVHLFSGMHFVTGAIGPSRVYATGGLRYWKDGRDVPDLLLGVYDYEATDQHPAFNLALRVNFEDGSGESSGFRFIGSEGILTIGNGVTVTKHPPSREPGYSIDTFSEATQQEFLKGYREKYAANNVNADSMRADQEEKYLPPPGYSDHRDHHRNFIQAVRSRKPVTEDPVFGFRAAGPALLSNLSYFEHRTCKWDPHSMVLLG